jgi:hypothetical protein
MGFHDVEGLLQLVRFAIESLRKTPWFLGENLNSRNMFSFSASWIYKEIHNLHARTSWVVLR